MLEQALGRSLRPEEAELLPHLSAVGMAKLNADLCRGTHARACFFFRVGTRSLLLVSDMFCHRLTA